MPRNVLIAPVLGFRGEADWERLEKTIHECSATRVRILTLPEAQDKRPEVLEHVRKQLAATAERWPLFDWDETHVDLFSFGDCLEAFARLMAEERGSHVTVSLGTAGAVGASAGAVACLLWRAEGVYVASPGYDAQPVEYLPTWLSAGQPVDDDALRVLKLVVDELDGLDKGTIVERLKESGRIRPDQDKHAYRRLGSILSGLTQQGFVTVGPRSAWDKRHHFVSATREGRRAYRVFAPMLREPRETLHVRGGRGPRRGNLGRV